MKFLQNNNWKIYNLLIEKEKILKLWHKTAQSQFKTYLILIGLVEHLSTTQLIKHNGL